jgi:hypothetical protein
MMKCPENDVFQAYMDGELEIGLKKKIEVHLAQCDKCRSRLAILKDNDDFVFNKLQNYSKYFEEQEVPYSTAPIVKDQNRNMNEKGVFQYMFKYRKIIAAACATLLITACITVQPVKAAIANALSIFRVENVKSITVTLKDIQEIQAKLSSGQGEINLDQIGNIKLQGGETRASSPKDIKNLPDIAVALPAVLSNEVPTISVVEPASIEFTLKVQSVNQLMRSFGATKLLPDSLDGKTFKADFPSQVGISYRTNDKLITITETRSPQLTVPEGVDVDEVYNAVVEMPILPEHLQSQLKSIKDWKNTVYIPVVESEMTEVDINGVKGYLSLQKDHASDSQNTWIVWYKEGVIYTVSGNASSDEIINIASSMR